MSGQQPVCVANAKAGGFNVDYGVRVARLPALWSASQRLSERRLDALTSALTHSALQVLARVAIHAPPRGVALRQLARLALAQRRAGASSTASDAFSRRQRSMAVDAAERRWGSAGQAAEPLSTPHRPSTMTSSTTLCTPSNDRSEGGDGEEGEECGPRLQRRRMETSGG